jgi:hypothetical protein
MQKPFNPDLFVARWYSSIVGPEDMPSFAADALEAGFDGPSLRRLAGLLKPTAGDVGDLFESALREIGTIKVQSHEQAIVLLSRQTAMDIVEGRIEPVHGADILARYSIILEHPDFLVQFLQLSEMPHWGDYAPSPKKLAQDIVAEARLLLANGPE